MIESSATSSNRSRLKQRSGLPDFALPSLVEDQGVLELVRDAAEQAMAKDPTLEKWPAMRSEFQIVTADCWVEQS